MDQQAVRFLASASRRFSQIFDGLSIKPVEDYPEQSLRMWQYIAALAA